MRFLSPIAVTDTVLISSSVPEDEFPLWSSTLTYPVDAVVINLATHEIYQSLVSGNLNRPPATSPLHWVLVNPTNRYAMFDTSRATPTIADGSITVTLGGGTAGSISLLDVVADSVRITVNGGGALLYDLTAQLTGIASLYLTDLPTGTGNEITITATSTGQVSIGSVQAGFMFRIGDTQEGLSISTTDYSVKKVDEFGNATLKKRNFARTMRASVKVAEDNVDESIRLLSAIRATPVIWIGSPRFSSTFIIGYLTEQEAVLSSSPLNEISLRIEGIAESDTFTFEDLANGGLGVPGATSSIGFAGGVTSYTGGPIGSGGGGAASTGNSLELYFNGDLLDSSGNGNHAAPYGGGAVRFVEPRCGSGALVGVASTINTFSVTGDFLLTAWMLVPPPGGGVTLLLGDLAVTTALQASISTTQQGGEGGPYPVIVEAVFQAFVAAADASGGALPLQTPVTAVPGDWVHVELSRVGATTRLFVAGQLIGSATLTGFSGPMRVYAGTISDSGAVDNVIFSLGTTSAAHTASFTVDAACTVASGGAPSPSNTLPTVQMSAGEYEASSATTGFVVLSLSAASTQPVVVTLGIESQEITPVTPITATIPAGSTSHAVMIEHADAHPGTVVSILGATYAHVGGYSNTAVYLAGTRPPPPPETVPLPVVSITPTSGNYTRGVSGVLVTINVDTPSHGGLDVPVYMYAGRDNSNGTYSVVADPLQGSLFIPAGVTSITLRPQDPAQWSSPLQIGNVPAGSYISGYIGVGLSNNESQYTRGPSSFFLNIV